MRKTQESQEGKKFGEGNGAIGKGEDLHSREVALDGNLGGEE